MKLYIKWLTRQRGSWWEQTRARRNAARRIAIACSWSTPCDWVCWGQMYVIIVVGVLFGGLLLYCIGKQVFEYCSKKCCGPREKQTYIDEETGEEIEIPTRKVFPPWVAPLQCLLCWLCVWQYRPCSRQERGGLYAPRRNCCPNKRRWQILFKYGRRIIRWWSCRADLNRALNVISRDATAICSLLLVETWVVSGKRLPKSSWLWHYTTYMRWFSQLNGRIIRIWIPWWASLNRKVWCGVRIAIVQLA